MSGVLHLTTLPHRSVSLEKIINIKKSLRLESETMNHGEDDGNMVANETNLI